jgi:L-fuculose-phosphate aldolase
MFADGLISSFDGNMSIRRGERIVITRRSAMLNGLEETDLIEMPMDATAHPPGRNEFNMHNAIYRTTTALAIVYAHPPTALALSLSPGPHEIASWEPELALLARNVPILDVEKVLGPKEFANVVCHALSGHSIMVAREHGSFAIGETLEAAYERTASLEHTSRAHHGRLVAQVVSRLQGPEGTLEDQVAEL